MCSYSHKTAASALLSLEKRIHTQFRSYPPIWREQKINETNQNFKWLWRLFSFQFSKPKKWCCDIEYTATTVHSVYRSQSYNLRYCFFLRRHCVLMFIRKSSIFGSVIDVSICVEIWYSSLCLFVPFVVHFFSDLFQILTLLSER